MTEAEHPEDGQRTEQPEAAEPTPPEAESVPAAAESVEPTPPAAGEPEAPPAAVEPTAAEPTVPEPEAAPTAAEPTAAESTAAEPEAPEPEASPTAAEPEAEEQPAASEDEIPPAIPVAARADEDLEAEEIDETPRLRPEIPGADLIPDIIPEGEEFLDAEARAAAEAEAAEAAAQAQDDAQDEPRPIADAAIDLAAGARYTSTGKRKTAVARVILKPGTGTYSINSKSLESFFPRETLQRMIRQPLETVGYEARMDVVARMHGGGVSAQAGALRHGISRALIVADPNLRGELKRRGFLTRDPRVKERKKAGLKKARKRPQFSKR